VLGWEGTSVRFSCTDIAQLVPLRAPNAEGIPQADIERVRQLSIDLRSVVWNNHDDCGTLVKQLDKFVARQVDEITLVRSLNTPSGKLPRYLQRDLMQAFDPLSGAHTCLEQKPVQDALERVVRALGWSTSSPTRSP
jgi:hypothetical protein